MKQKNTIQGQNIRPDLLTTEESQHFLHRRLLAIYIYS
jgi:hypothetical protein